MKLLLGEIFEQVKEAKTNEEKVAILKKNDHNVVRELLKINFNPAVKFLIPKKVEFRANDAPLGLSETNLWNEFRKMYLFIEGGHQTLQQARREVLFIQLLEGLHKKDADLLVALKDKKIKGVSEKVVNDAFPGLLPTKEK
jgi:hypothetical protein